MPVLPVPPAAGTATTSTGLHLDRGRPPVLDAHSSLSCPRWVPPGWHHGHRARDGSPRSSRMTHPESPGSLSHSAGPWEPGTGRGGGGGRRPVLPQAAAAFIWALVCISRVVGVLGPVCLGLIRPIGRHLLAYTWACGRAHWQLPRHREATPAPANAPGPVLGGGPGALGPRLIWANAVRPEEQHP